MQEGEPGVKTDTFQEIPGIQVTSWDGRAAGAQRCKMAEYWQTGLCPLLEAYLQLYQDLQPW